MNAEGALTLDLSHPRCLHIVGIGGAGMSAIALVLARMGHVVSGSDLKDSRGIERLRLVGVDAHIGHNARHIPDAADAVIRSTAIPDTNPEVVAARERGVPVLRRADALRALVATRRAAAVSGSHGKTTTSSMLALILRAAGWNPSFLIGGELNEVGTNAAYDDGEWLVVEADESDGTFLELEPEAILITNVEPDHLDYYGTFDALIGAFREFVEHARGVRVLCGDDPVASALAAANPGTRTYGFLPGLDYRIVNYTGGRSGSRFELQHDGRTLGGIELPVPGPHNALNAAGASALALELGVPFPAVTTALRGFGGVARRFQSRGEINGVTLVDDYAHNPGKVAAVVRAALEGEWRRVIVVFQPHRYTRTEALWREFGDVFHGVDRVVLTEIYGAGEAPRPGVSGHLVLQAILDAHPETEVVYLPHRRDLLPVVERYARPGDLVLTLGAGDVTSLPDEWLRRAAVVGS